MIKKEKNQILKNQRIFDESIMILNKIDEENFINCVKFLRQYKNNVPELNNELKRNNSVNLVVIKPERICHQTTKETITELNSYKNDELS